MKVNETQQRLLRRDEAAQYLNEIHGLPETKQGLAKKAVYGDGPAFRKYGRHPLYAPADLDAFARDALSPPILSTAQLPAAQRRRTA